MIAFPNAKINLGLNIVRRRADGFHDIETVMVPVGLHDVLEVIVDPSLPAGEVVYSRSGIALDGTLESDLCMRAVRLIGRNLRLPGLRMHLHKVIPIGAGLGGGSSDAAHALLLLDKLLDLRQGRDRLDFLAAELGSDCPFFIEGRPCIATGRGELLRPMQLDLSIWMIQIVHPGIHVPTAQVYGQIDSSGRSVDLASILHGSDPSAWQDQVINSMEKIVFAQHPAVEAIKSRLLAEGASYASMSGSGSAVFGIFRTTPPIMQWPNGYRSWNVRALS
ncbi:MAG: 4-(cytidine 5'-diphospho)-2-C-methyl-D-erythritol kinase [Flavobacteriales bacterium]|nr:4-(cytidine 5'-diphospho)-2-C-methyl-D-erythritol kinase [Flavobacteriales bacterium]